MIRQATLPLLFVLSPSLQPDPGALLARKLRKAVLRRQPVVVGTPAAPYEPAIGRGEDPLRQSLLPAEGLEIAITTATPRIVRQLDLLVELDRRHSVAVRMVLPAAADDPEPWMRAVRSLTAEGIATSVLLSPAAPGRRNGEETFRFLLEGALEAGAVDVEVDLHSLRRGMRLPLLTAFQRLRLEYGFPRRAAGRG